MATVTSFFRPLGTTSPIIRRVESTRKRKEAAAQRLAMYYDDQDNATLAELKKRFANVDSRFQVFCINVIKKIIDKKSMVYLDPPSRVFENWDQEKGEELYRSIAANAVLKKAHKLTKLFKTTLLKVSVRNDAPRLDVIAPHILDVDFSDPEDPDRIYLTRPGPADSKHPEREVRYHVWTRGAFHIYDWRGNSVAIPGNEAGLNPYGVLPFVSCFDRPPDDQFFLPGGDDLVKGQIAINTAVMNLWRTIEFQAHGQPWSVGLSPQHQLQLGPDKVVNLPDGGSLNYAAPNAPIEAVLKSIEALLKHLATTNDLSSSVFEINQRVESGQAKQAEQRDLLEARKDDTAIWRRYENQLFDLLKIVVNTHAPGSIPEAAKLRVDFAEIQDDISLSERLKGYQARIDMGIWSAVDALMEDNPDVASREKAREILQQVSNENAALGRPLAGPAFPLLGASNNDG
jgi:hypothetical protein